MKTKKQILFVLVTFALFVIVCEAGLRICGFSTALCEPCPLIGYRHAANKSYRIFGENDHHITGRYNSYGWRDKEWTLRKPPGVKRVAVLGDSFVEALQVEQDRTFIGLLDTPGVEFMNFGIFGASQDKELLILQHEVGKFDPDVVMCFFFPPNDIRDMDNSVRPGRLWEATYFIRRYSALAHFVCKQAFIITGAGDSEFPAYLSLCTDNPDEGAAKKYERCKEALCRMNEWCAARGITFGLACINTDAYLAEREKQYKGYDSSFEANYFEDDLRAFAADRGMYYLGLQRTFKQADTQLTWRHWNYEGHELVAKAVTDVISQALDGSYRVKDLVWAEEIWWATYHGGGALEYGASLREAIVTMGINPANVEDGMKLLRRSELEAAREVVKADFEPQYNPPWHWCFDWCEGKTQEGYK